jgi:hypothetical protein
MGETVRPALLAALAALAAPAGPAHAAATRVLVVMSADTGPYREAVAGAVEVLGEEAHAVVAGKAPPPVPGSVTAVIVLGSRASLFDFPGRLRFVQAMNPGVPGVGLKAVRIAMEADPAVLTDRLLRLQPSLARLAVLHQTGEAGEYAADLVRAGAARGVAVRPLGLADSGELPDALRRLAGTVDALWIPPDPLLVNAGSLTILVEFARANRVPLYVPTAGLVALGATAAVAPTFREYGRLGARAAAGTSGPPGAVIYPTEVETVVSRKGMAAVGLVLGDDPAVRVLP